MNGKNIMIFVAAIAMGGAMVSNLEWATRDYGLEDIALNRDLLSQGQKTCVTKLMEYATTGTGTGTGGTGIGTGGTGTGGGTVKGGGTTPGRIYYQYVQTQITRTGTTVVESWESGNSVVGGNVSANIGTGGASVGAGIHGETGVSGGTKVTTTYSIHQAKIGCAIGTRFYPCSEFWTDIP